MAPGLSRERQPRHDEGARSPGRRGNPDAWLRSKVALTGSHLTWRETRGVTAPRPCNGRGRAVVQQATAEPSVVTSTGSTARRGRRAFAYGLGCRPATGERLQRVGSLALETQYASYGRAMLPAAVARVRASKWRHLMPADRRLGSGQDVCVVPAHPKSARRLYPKANRFSLVPEQINFPPLSHRVQLPHIPSVWCVS